MEYVRELYRIEKSTMDSILEFHQDHMEIPILACCVYLYFLTYGPKWISKPWEVKGLLVTWNVLLCIFSVMGTLVSIIEIGEKIETDGFQASCCEENWFVYRPVGTSLMIFIYSKFFELVDTVFLIIRKKEVIFLHWFHHVTVLLYCWHSFHHTVPIGVYFAMINYGVHSIMYAYYALAIAGYKFVFMFSPLVTTIQLVQMIGGMGFIIYVVSVKAQGIPCAMDSSNWKLGLSMYASYFVLFGVLFYEKYIAKKPKKEQKEVAACFDQPKKVDGAGFFHSERDAKKKDE